MAQQIPALHDPMTGAQPAHELIVVPAAGEPGRQELLQQCYDLRVEVFHREQGFSLEDEFDEYAFRALAPLVPD